MEQNGQSELMSHSRRRALKIGVAGAAGAAVWAEPTIRGLARRPAYAATASGAPVVFDLTTFTDPFGLPTQSGVLEQSITVDGVTLTVTRGTNANGSRNEEFTFVVSGGAATYTLQGTVTFTSNNGMQSGSDTFDAVTGPQTLNSPTNAPRLNLSTTITCT
jgi:hypothetical protein